MGLKDPTLLDAISKEVLRKLDEIEPQSLGILADAKLACRGDVERALQPLAEKFVDALPASLDAASVGAFTQFVHGIRVDNFGAWGTRYVFRRMNFAEPPSEFCERAAQQILQNLGGAGDENQKGREVVNALSGAALVHRRVFSYAEYDMEVPGHSGVTVPLAGSITKENGRRDSGGSGGSGSGGLPLRALASPISGLVDRSLCSEHQVLAAIGELLGQATGGGASQAACGRVRLFISTAPCVSCIWTLRQFQLLLPRMTVEVGNGEEAYLFSTA